MQNKGSEQVQRRARRLRTSPAPPEAGGRGEGKGAGPAQGLHPLLHCKQAFSFQPKTSRDSGWSTSTGRATARQRAQAPDVVRGLELGTRRAEGALHLGRVRLSSSWLPELLSWEGKKSRRSFLFHAFVEHLRAGTACSAGHAPYRAAGSLSSVEGKAARPLLAARRN